MKAGAGAAPTTRKPGQSAHAESTQGVFPWKNMIYEKVWDDDCCRIIIIETCFLENAPFSQRCWGRDFRPESRNEINRATLRTLLIETCLQSVPPPPPVAYIWVGCLICFQTSCQLVPCMTCHTVLTEMMADEFIFWGQKLRITKQRQLQI